MIKSFKHKGLRRFYETRSKQGIQAQQAPKIRMQLAALDSAHDIEDLDVPGYRLHQLKGERTGIWSITLSGNGRIRFEFVDGNAYIVNYEDYH
jgi:proteic killer suppression protein